MSAIPTDTMLAFAKALSDGLDLCVRAKQLDADIEKTFAFTGRDGGTRCGTPALWIQDQYDRDLVEWEAKTRKLLLESGFAERVRP